MKKILFLTAMVSLLFAACNNEPEPPTEEVKKLPSKEIHPYSQDREIINEYYYDELNRLICITRRSDTIDISYNADGTPEKCMFRRNSQLNALFQYSGNQVSINGIPAILLNDKEQAIEIKYSTVIVDTNETEYCTYDENGSWIRSEYSNHWTSATPSEVPGIYRYVNTPEWLLLYLLQYISCPYKVGYLPEEWIDSRGNTGKSFFELDADGYPVKIEEFVREANDRTYTGKYTFEYTPAK